MSKVKNNKTQLSLTPSKASVKSKGGTCLLLSVSCYSTVVCLFLVLSTHVSVAPERDGTKESLTLMKAILGISWGH